MANENKLELWNEYIAELGEIAQECADEGYPSNGSNYEIRAERLREYYPELFEEEDYGEIERDDAISYLESGIEDCYIQDGSRTAIIGNMCGGRFEMYDHREFCGVTNSAEEAVDFILGGKR